MRDKIRQLKEKIDKTEFDPPILERKSHYTNARMFENPEDFLPANTKISQGLLNSFSDLHNKQKFANYVDDLVGEVTRRMLSSGNVALKAKARNGIIDQDALIAVLTDRLKARGLSISMIPKDTSILNFRGFQKFIRKGPVVDEALGQGHRLANSHGVYPHILQLDYVLPTIEKEVGRNKFPVVFEYFGTDRGLKYWNETFDLFGTESKASTNATFLKKNIMDKDGLNLP